MWTVDYYYVIFQLIWWENWDVRLFEAFSLCSLVRSVRAKKCDEVILVLKLFRFSWEDVQLSCGLKCPDKYLGMYSTFSQISLSFHAENMIIHHLQLLISTSAILPSAFCGGSFPQEHGFPISSWMQGQRQDGIQSFTHFSSFLILLSSGSYI